MLSTESSLFSLPPELLHVIVVLSTTEGPIYTLAAISQTCKTLHALVYNPEDHSLWREIFSNFFDDPRPAQRLLAVLHGKQPDFVWREELQRRMRAAQVVRVSNRLSSPTSETATLAPRLEETLRTILGIIGTSLPLFNTQISIGTTTYAGREVLPAFPPLVLLLAADLCGFSPLPGSDLTSRSALWLETLLRNGFPRMPTRRLLADPNILPTGEEDDVRQGTAAQAKTKFWEASEESRLFYKLVAHTGFIPVREHDQGGVPLPEEAAPSEDLPPSSNSGTPAPTLPEDGPPEPEMRSEDAGVRAQTDSARRKARTIVYDLKYLKPDRLYGPFMSSTAGGDGLDGDRASAVSLMSMADEGDEDSDDPDYEPDEAEAEPDMDTDAADDAGADGYGDWEEPHHMYPQPMHAHDDDDDDGGGGEDEDEGINGEAIVLPLVDLVTIDPQSYPPREPPLPHNLVPDWKWLSAARMVVEANIRDMLVRTPTEDDPEDDPTQILPQDENVLQEVKNALKRIEGLRMGGAPDFWTGGWADKVAAAKGGDDDTPPANRKGKGRAVEEAQEEGWDWAGVAGVYRRCTCWLDYRDLLSESAPQHAQPILTTCKPVCAVNNVCPRRRSLISCEAELTLSSFNLLPSGLATSTRKKRSGSTPWS